MNCARCAEDRQKMDALWKCLSVTFTPLLIGRFLDLMALNFSHYEEAHGALPAWLTEKYSHIRRVVGGFVS
jgi:hypothetical protein